MMVTLPIQEASCNQLVQKYAFLTAKRCQMTGTHSKNIPSICVVATGSGSVRTAKPTTGEMVQPSCSITAKKKTVILTRQFRFPVYINGHDGYLIETAAGLLDNMAPEKRIKAEVEEETGYQIDQVEKVFEAFMSPGSVTEKLYFYIAEYHAGDRTGAGGGIEAEGEDIEVLEWPIEQALQAIDDGTIVDGKTIMLLYHVALKKIV